jgi:pimeloyl-ACP methyl ester carboxylesterase
MDGTGALFAQLVRGLPTSPPPVVISYPADAAIGICGLVDFVESRLPPGEPFVLVGESFSGIVAARLAARRPPGLAGLALVASFLRYPQAAAFAWRALARDLVFRVQPPPVIIRALLVGLDAPEVLVDDVRAAIRSVAPIVVASRLREALAADMRGPFAASGAPVLYIRGARDRLVGDWAANQVRAVRSDAEVVTMDAPHLVLQRCPELAAAALVAFGRRCLTVSGG